MPNDSSRKGSEELDIPAFLRRQSTDAVAAFCNSDKPGSVGATDRPLTASELAAHPNGFGEEGDRASDLTMSQAPAPAQVPSVEPGLTGGARVLRGMTPERIASMLAAGAEETATEPPRSIFTPAPLAPPGENIAGRALHPAELDNGSDTTQEASESLVGPFRNALLPWTWSLPKKPRLKIRKYYHDDTGADRVRREMRRRRRVWGWVLTISIPFSVLAGALLYDYTSDHALKRQVIAWFDTKQQSRTAPAPEPAPPAVTRGIARPAPAPTAPPQGDDELTQTLNDLAGAITSAREAIRRQGGRIDGAEKGIADIKLTLDQLQKRLGTLEGAKSRSDEERAARAAADTQVQSALAELRGKLDTTVAANVTLRADMVALQGKVNAAPVALPAPPPAKILAPGASARIRAILGEHASDTPD